MDAIVYSQKSAAINAGVKALREKGVLYPKPGYHFDVDRCDSGWFWFSWIY